MQLVLLQIIQMAQMQQMQAAQMGRPVSEQQMNQIIMTQVKEGLQQTTDKVHAKYGLEQATMEKFIAENESDPGTWFWLSEFAFV